MDVVKLGKKGQVSIPKGVLTQLGLEGERLLLVETTADGGILLRPAGVYPLETYSDERIQVFLAEDALTEDEAARLRAKLNTPRS
jgi:AbrB family looped-hinge helix DNA binding protein